jgi:hypothetical protein
MQVDRVEVTVRGDFGGEGDPASQIRYQVRVEAPSHTETEIRGLVDFVDNVAEIHNTLRQGVAVTLEP